MKKYLAIGAGLLFAFPAYAADCVAPIAPHDPDSGCIYQSSITACLSEDAEFESALAEYNAKLTTYNECIVDATNEALGVNPCASVAPENGSAKLDTDTRKCIARCDFGYYMTNGGACRIEAGTIEKQKRDAINAEIAAQDAVPIQAPVATSTPAVAPVVQPTTPVTPSKPIYDYIPFLTAKHDAPVSQAKVEATTTATVTVSATPVAPSLLHRILRAINPLNWF